MNPRVNKWLDLLDRAGWTAVQALGGAIFVVLTSSGIGWEEGAKFVLGAGALAVVKVIIGQNTGSDDTGALIGQAVIEPSPTDKP